jgi:hypothetical protein
VSPSCALLAFRAPPPPPPQVGYDSAVTIATTSFERSLSVTGGGLLVTFGSSARIVACGFLENTAVLGGGGVFVKATLGSPSRESSRSVDRLPSRWWWFVGSSSIGER